MIDLSPTLEQAVNQYTGAAALAILVIDKVVIPFAKKIFPIKAKQADREEQRKDDEIKFEHEMKRRNVEVLEELKRNAVQQTEISRVTNERLTNIEGEVKEIKQAVSARRKPRS